MNDYKKRKYLSSLEAAKYLDISARELHYLIKANKIKCIIAGSGQKRLDLQDLKNYEINNSSRKTEKKKAEILTEKVLLVNNNSKDFYQKCNGYEGVSKRLNSSNDYLASLL